MISILRNSCHLSTTNSRLYSGLVSTVDTKEIERFQQVTSEWWNEFGPMKGLHSMNRLRVPFIRDGLINEGLCKIEDVSTPQPLKGLSILDVGCGGILAECLARLGANVTGIDANPSIVDIAKSHSEKSGLHIDYLFSSIEQHSESCAGKYDAIAASEILEHVNEKEQFLSACSTCLKPSGSLFITTINKSFLAGILGIFFVENVMQIVPKGTHDLNKFIEPHKLQRLLEDCDLHTKLIHGMFYNLLTNTWTWCPDTSINYCVHACKTNSSN